MEYVVHLGSESVDAIKQACGTEIEELNVTENGTYTAPSGKAYNPVIVNVESGGGGDTEQWETLFDGEVTTIESGDFNVGLEVVSNVINADKIKVTFNGVEYICEGTQSPFGGCVYGGMTDDGADFTEYPFAILTGENSGGAVMQIITETAGTYSLKIEAQEGEESGGDSDFSIGEVSFKFINADPDADRFFYIPMVIEDATSAGFPFDKTIVVRPFQYQNSVIKMPVYDNLTIFGQTFMSGGSINNITCEGSAEIMGGGVAIVITGDCEITIEYQNIS